LLNYNKDLHTLSLPYIYVTSTILVFIIVEYQNEIKKLE